MPQQGDVPWRLFCYVISGAGANPGLQQGTRIGRFSGLIGNMASQWTLATALLLLLSASAALAGTLDTDSELGGGFAGQHWEALPPSPLPWPRGGSSSKPQLERQSRGKAINKSGIG